MPGNLNKKLRNLKQQQARQHNIPKSLEADAEQNALFYKLGMQQMQNIDKVQVFQGEDCLEFNHQTVMGNGQTMWAVKGAHKVIPAATTQSEIQQKKSTEEFMKLLQAQHAQNKNGQEEAPVEEAKEEPKAEEKVD